MIISFSGPHGAGKSSFIKAVEVACPEYALYPDKLQFVKVDDPLARNRSKYVKYYHERLDQENFERETGKHVLADRCVYDGIVYGRAFVDLGWIDRIHQETNEQIGRLLFPVMPDYLVVLNPPLDSIKERLKTRWAKKDKKWREEDTSYLRAAHEGYKSIDQIFEGKHLLKIEDDISLSEEVKRFLAWSKKLVNLDELIVA